MTGLRKLTAITQILETLVFSGLAIFIGFYLLYLTICLLVARITHTKPTIPTTAYSPRVSIIIPTYNEAEVIQRKIQNLCALHYPKHKFEAIFVDGASNDGTVDLLERSAKETDFIIKVIRQAERNGYNNAVIEGFAASNGELICLTGAETEYDPEALNIMVARLSDPMIGAVTGKQRLKVQDGYSPKLETAYRSLYDFVREAETKIDSPFDIKGEISAARREIIACLVEKPEFSNKGNMDCCISFQARMNQQRTVYEPRAVYTELPPRTIRDSFKQTTRRAVLLVQNMMIFKEMILNRKYGLFGILIMPAHFLMLVVLPYLLALVSIGLIIAFVLQPSNYLLGSVIGFGLLAIIASSALQAFLKTQLTLVIGGFTLLFGTETQKLERLPSTRRY